MQIIGKIDFLCSNECNKHQKKLANSRQIGLKFAMLYLLSYWHKSSPVTLELMSPELVTPGPVRFILDIKTIVLQFVYICRIGVYEITSSAFQNPHIGLNIINHTI